MEEASQLVGKKYLIGRRRDHRKLNSLSLEIRTTSAVRTLFDRVNYSVHLAVVFFSFIFLCLPPKETTEGPPF